MYPPDEEPRIKFYNVPYEYDDLSVKHADLIGSYSPYKGGDVWFVMKGKRLFRAPDDIRFPPPRPREYSHEVPMMSPDELREALKSYRPFEEMLQEFLEWHSERKAFLEGGGKLEECGASAATDEATLGDARPEKDKEG